MQDLGTEGNPGKEEQEVAGKYIKKVVGVVPWSFDKDGKHFEGVSLHTLEDLDPKQGMGKLTEKISLSREKLDAAGVEPLPGQTIQIVYNRFGRVETIILISDPDFDTGFDD